MIEGSWLCPVLVLPKLNRFENKLFYDEEDVWFSSPKTVETYLCQEFVTC